MTEHDKVPQGTVVRLPLHAAAQWATAVACAESDPFKHVVLDAQTVLAVHDALATAMKEQK